METENVKWLWKVYKKLCQRIWNSNYVQCYKIKDQCFKVIFDKLQAI
jgi:hypothetical protein